jgi:hypothetical protein
LAPLRRQASGRFLDRKGKTGLGGSSFFKKKESYVEPIGAEEAGQDLAN